MASVKDERGFNQSFVKTLTTELRLNRRFDYMIDQMSDNNHRDYINVLEVGCAEGYGLKYLIKKTNFNGLGIDISRKFIEIARKDNDLKNLSFELVDFNFSVSELIQYSKIVFTVSGNTGFEALIRKKPVIVFLLIVIF